MNQTLDPAAAHAAAQVQDVTNRLTVPWQQPHSNTWRSSADPTGSTWINIIAMPQVSHNGRVISGCVISGFGGCVISLANGAAFVWPPMMVLQT